MIMAWVFRDLNDSAAMSSEQIKEFITHMNKMLVHNMLVMARKPLQILTCGRGWTLGPRTMQWSAPPANASSNMAFRRSGCCGSRPTR